MFGGNRHERAGTCGRRDAGHRHCCGGTGEQSHAGRSSNAGSLTLRPSSLTWAATLTGLDQKIVDTVPDDQTYSVTGATGNGAGWHVTTSATHFTTGGVTLANVGTLSANGSVSSQSSTSAPTAACHSGSTCTLPTNTTTYPVAITTAASSPTAFTIYDAGAATGLGMIDIGGSAQPNPVGWWVSLPSTVLAGTYTSTNTMQIVSGP
jgi:hypothetical protein